VRPRRPDVEAGARFLVQWVRRGEARGYAGRVGAGAFALGDRVRVVASGVTSSIVRIETLGEDGATRAGAGTSATFTLADSVDVARGDTLVRADDPAPSLTREVAVELAWLSREPLRVGAPYALKHGTRRVRAVVDRVEGVLDVASGEARPAEGLVMNDLGRVQLRTSEPLPWDRYDTARALGRAILIAPTTAETVGAAIHR
jgi:sulfate adenylyltransferase subunit 1